MNKIKRFLDKIFVINPFAFFCHSLNLFFIKRKYNKDIGCLKRAENIEYQRFRNQQILLLKKKFRLKIISTKEEIIKNGYLVEHNRSNKIWFCWFQGMDNAPDLVKACYDSLKKHLSDREIIVITEENYKKYVTFPKYIEEGVESKEISYALFSDLLRLNLLNTYGGTWIDSTVFCSSDNIPDFMLNSDLFFFQTIDNESLICGTRTESWFLTACSNNPILLMTQQLLYEYLRRSTSLNDYLIFYDILEIAIEQFPEELNNVVPFPRTATWLLVDNWTRSYSEELFKQLTSLSPFHKLTNRYIPNEEAIGEDSIYFYLKKKKIIG